MYFEKINLRIKENLEIVDITQKVREAVESSRIREGFAVIFTQHTTSGIRINENEEFLMEDMRNFLENLAPSSKKYKHDDIEKRDCPPDERINGHSHLKALLLGASETIPIKNNLLCLGKWQSIFYMDLDGCNRERHVIIQVFGEK
jgi:secondary thiamine-phosphate synthase enzyme